jgi:hypothetical protein
MDVLAPVQPRSDFGAILPAARGVGLALFAGLLLAVTAGSAAPPARAAAPQPATPAAAPLDCPPEATVMTSPNVGASSNHLWSAAAAADGDVWAVGNYDNGAALRTLTQRWDGGAWRVVPSPNNGAGSNRLNAVTALAPDDVWAVGYYTSTTNTTPQTLIEHWTGAAWTIVPSPNAGPDDNELWAVRGSAAGDVWASGSYHDTDAQVYRTLIEHWDGVTWRVIPSPSPGGPGNYLDGLVALAADNAWAVGGAGQGGVMRTLLLHWDGQTWSRIPSPNVGAGDNLLWALDGPAANDLWAVGCYIDGGVQRTLALHWDGAAWRAAPVPNAGAYGDDLLSVVALATDDVWAAGTYHTPTGDQSLVERWDGRAWAMAPGPAANTGSLEGIAGRRGVALWAVGSRETRPDLTETLVQQYSVACLTPSPGPCGLAFQDVQPADYFYTSVETLACRGALSGYGDGTFRPYNGTTRGQLVKIVVLGLGVAPLTPGAGSHTFADVRPGDPFFADVETAAGRGLISGYTCGGPGEPCDSANRPYFRPNSAVTRGQLAKIVVAAAGWPLLAPATGAFADVPPGTAFFGFVETAASHAVISGYTCGGPGEPCDTQRRPYFRQYVNTVRGQVAKIVYGAAP